MTIGIKVKGWEVSEEFVDHSNAHCSECGTNIPQHQNPVKGSEGEIHIKDNTFIVAKERAIHSLGHVNDHSNIYCSDECLSVWAKKTNEYLEQRQRYLDSIDTSKVPF